MCNVQVASALHSQAWKVQHPRAFVVVSTVSELCSRNWKLMNTMQPREKNSHWSRTYFSLTTLTYFLFILGKHDLIALDLLNAEPYSVWLQWSLQWSEWMFCFRKDYLYLGCFWAVWVNGLKGWRSRILSCLSISSAGLSPPQTQSFLIYFMEVVGDFIKCIHFCGSFNKIKTSTSLQC